jgi:hypothetical protein
MKFLKKSFLVINLILIFIIIVISHNESKIQNELLILSSVLLLIIIFLNFFFFKTEFAKYSQSVSRRIKVGDYLIYNSQILLAFIVYDIAQLFFESFSLTRILVLFLWLIYSFSLMYIRKNPDQSS